jgi:hypothetical protein
MKKIIIVILSAFFALSMMNGCITTKTPIVTKKKVVSKDSLRYWYQSDFETYPDIERLKNDFTYFYNSVGFVVHNKTTKGGISYKGSITTTQNVDIGGLRIPPRTRGRLLEVHITPSKYVGTMTVSFDPTDPKATQIFIVDLDAYGHWRFFAEDAPDCSLMVSIKLKQNVTGQMHTAKGWTVDGGSSQPQGGNGDPHRNY